MNRISEIQIVSIKPNSGLVAFGSLLLNGELYLGSIGIHTKLDGLGYRITYPSKKVGDTNLNLFHPVTRELGLEIEKAIISRYKELTNG